MKPSEEGQKAVCGVIAKLDRPWKNDKQKARFYGSPRTLEGWSGEGRGEESEGLAGTRIRCNATFQSWRQMGPARRNNGSGNTLAEVSSRHKMGKKEPERQSV